MWCKLILLTSLVLVLLAEESQARRVGHCGLKCFRWRKCMGQLGEGENRPGQLGDTGQIVLKTCSAGKCDCAKVLEQEEEARKKKKNDNNNDNNNEEEEEEKEERRSPSFGNRGRLRSRGRVSSLNRGRSNTRTNENEEENGQKKAVWADETDSDSHRLRSAGLRSRFLSFRHTDEGVKTALAENNEEDEEEEVEKDDKRRSDLKRFLSERIRRRY